ncbi:MAG: chorismate-binding protein [Nannocystaceae bacterium]
MGASVAVAWLDGGPETHGWFASEVMEEVSGETRGALDVLDRKWREDPSAVWIGWLTYEFGRAHGRTGAARLPALCMRKYANATRLAPGQTPASVAASVADTDSCWWPLSPLQPTLAPDEFRRRVSAAKELIARGDTYQVNLSQEFRAAYESSICDPGSRDEAWLRRMALRLFASLRDRAPASMGGLIQAEGAWIVSNSPERLLSVSLGAAGSPDVACSSPIKGTRRRGADAGEDAAAIEELCGCDKERAEHVMIVDLVRNDLGRCARPGTVRTSPTPRVVSLPTVHHLVTDVECELRKK